MIQRRSGASLTLESFKRRSILFEFYRQEFQGDMTAEIEIFSLVHYTHAPTAKLVQDTVMGDGFAGHEPKWLQK